MIMATDENGSGIAIWGPTGSGKDWLIRGFAKELQHFNREYPDFSFELYDEEDNPIVPVPPTKATIDPTSDQEDFVLKFVRRPTSQNPDHAHRISAHSHKINIHNDAGAKLLSILVDQKGFEDTFRTVMDSQFLIVVLDPTYVVNNPDQTRRQTDKKNNNGMDFTESDNDDFEMSDENYPPIANQKIFSRDEYIQIVHYLLMALSKDAGQRRYLAICLTKMDKKKVRGNPKDLIKRIFGQGMYDLLESYKRTFEIEVFATSSVGFVKKRIGGMGVRASNEASGDLIDPAQWQPVNTAAPFFWIFESSEKEKIKASGGLLSNNLKDYIEYPSRAL